MPHNTTRKIKINETEWKLIAYLSANGKSFSKEFELRSISTPELKLLREGKKPYFILKKGDRLFAAKIVRDINFVSTTLWGRPHKCACAGRECLHLSAANDEKGGCEKVRKYSTQIEDYPWITLGYETFNTINDAMVVLECEHFEKMPYREPLPRGKAQSLKLSIAQYVWPDAKDANDVRKRLYSGGDRHFKY